MKKMWKKIVSVLLVFAILICVNLSRPVIAEAGTGFVPFDVEVIKDNAPLRQGASQEGKVFARTYSGRILHVVDSKVNSKGNLWYLVDWKDSSDLNRKLWIYSGNVGAHEHAYMCVEYNGIIYSVCECGYAAYGGELTQEKKKEGNTVVSALSVAGVASVADGPIPAGDALGAIIVLGAVSYELALTLPNVLSKIVTDVDFVSNVNNIKSKEKDNSCPANPFYIVTYLDPYKDYIVVDKKTCMDMASAYAAAYVLQQNVYTKKWTVAEALASRGENGYDADPPHGYNGFRHYHFKDSDGGRRGGHIFYGQSVGSKEWPKGLN